MDEANKNVQDLLSNYGDMFDFGDMLTQFSVSDEVKPKEAVDIDDVYASFIYVLDNPSEYLDIRDVLDDYSSPQPTIVMKMEEKQVCNFVSCVQQQAEELHYSLTPVISRTYQVFSFDYGYNDDCRDTIAYYYDKCVDDEFCDFGSGDRRYCRWMAGKCQVHVDIKNIHDVSCDCGVPCIPRIDMNFDQIISFNTIQILRESQLESLLSCGASVFKFVYPIRRNSDETDPMHVLKDYSIVKHGIYSTFFPSKGVVGDSWLYTEIRVNVNKTGLFLNKNNFSATTESENNVSVFLMVTWNHNLYVVEKNKSPHVDFICGGKVESGETVSEALSREMSEEIGIKIDSIYLGYSNGVHTKGFVFYYHAKLDIGGVVAKENRGVVVPLSPRHVLRHDLLVGMAFLEKAGYLDKGLAVVKQIRTWGKYVHTVSHDALIRELDTSNPRGMLVGMHPVVSGENVMVNVGDGMYDYQYNGRKQAVVKVTAGVGVAVEVLVPVSRQGGAIVPFKEFDFDGQRMYFSGSINSVHYLKRLMRVFGYKFSSEQVVRALQTFRTWVDVTPAGVDSFARKIEQL